MVKSQGGKILGKEISQEEYNKAILMIEKKDKIIFHYHNVLKQALLQAKKNKLLHSFDPRAETHWNNINF